MKRVLSVLAAILVCISGCTTAVGRGGNGSPSAHRPAASSSPTPRDARPVRLTIPGTGALGIFDPGPAADPGDTRIWMSYSSVERSKWPANKRISTRITHSNDGGRTWVDDLAVNASTDVNLPLPAPNNAGTWQHEVARLAYDPYAPATRRWALVWMRYLEVNGVRHFDHTWIAMRTGSSPAGTWSAERKLLVGSGYPPQDDGISGPPQYRLSSLDPDLADCVAATEPGLLARPDALYMSLYCSAADPGNGRQILLRQTRATGRWEYVGSLTTNASARALGFDDYSATELVERDNRQLLVVSPEKGGRYKGCLVFEIADLSVAKLVGGAGSPTVVGRIELDLGHQGFGGACGYSPALRVGLLYSELFPDPPQFRIFETNVEP